jgi:drug/metabolite transporter (DMT)-like permease
MSYARTVILTTLAMVAFAGNSLLCRIALRGGHVDAVSFTTLRLAFGALALWLVVRVKGGNATGRGNWLSSLALFVYAIGFSLAYVTLPLATGALLLFGAVQATMIGYGIWKGERLRPLQMVGLALALGGVIGLMMGGIKEAPSLVGSSLMLAAGVAWGVYSLRGKTGGDPTRVTEGNFWGSVPFAVAFGLCSRGSWQADSIGIWCAIASGALTSGVGYAVWYTVLPTLKPSQAATVQLSVPIIGALGGVVLLGEPITLRLILASVAVLGGIALVIFGKQKSSGN